MTSIKKEVLQAFKALHRTRMKVFRGDEKALAASRERINDEFRKNKDEHNDKKIRDMVIYAKDVENELKTSVIQAEEVSPGIFKLHITEDTRKFDNKPFDPNAEIPRKGKRAKPCCQETLAGVK